METNYQIVEIDAVEATSRLPELSEILVDAVTSGASVSFMMPFTVTEAIAYWQSILPAVAQGRTILLVALVEGRAFGTVQLSLTTPPNQSHRADVAKLLVHRQVRRQRIARKLMQRIEEVAISQGRTLLTLDTMTNSIAEELYLSLGYVLVGKIPNYAYFPDGLLGDTSILYKHLVAES
ncbi:GCN5-related N-acetyltransferase [Nostoc sp. NIES-3756]|uniref:GNAT family N-acetyltransferase n=1 Tax=Nostoc sp. NIES-3756 TaxID=1751286 RepID=UPI000722E8BE|nr:GNAT family N-acetyltransferase [Nostoc sp. NIES-3756]BAT53313.1 GCN5-related N-acetyltransferase [Nostoc sp. NIES-3756]